MPIFAWWMDNPFFNESNDDSFIDSSTPVEVFTHLADARKWSQSKTFEFGMWNFDNALQAQERFDNYLCPSDAWGCWIPGQIVATGGTMIGFAPLFATTLMAYTNPYTAGPAFALDAYNIYRYFD